MRAVRGTVVKSRSVSISRAANIVSRFAAAAAAGDIGATRELAAYIGRSARAIDELDQLHLHLRSRYLTPKSDPEATFSLDDNHEKQRVADREEDQKKKKSVIDAANEQVARINVDLITRLPDAAEEVPDENRKKKKRKRKVDDDDNDDEEKRKTGTNINLGNENNEISINGGIIVHDADSENRKKKRKKIEGEFNEEGQKDSTRSSNGDKIEEVAGSGKRKKKKEKLYEANVVQEDGDMTKKSKKFFIKGDQEGEGDAFDYGSNIKNKKNKRRKVDVGD